MSNKPPYQLEKASLEALGSALHRLEQGFSALPAAPDQEQDISRVLAETAERLHDNYPYFHPLYAGQMLKPPHPIARAAYALAMWINPNNHALDGGRASSRMEKEAVTEIAGMFGWSRHLGHLCGGGTMANLEALWIAGQLHPGKAVLASEQAHYTHERISNVLGLKFEAIACDESGRIDVKKLRRRLVKGDVGTVVASMGTTGVGAIDPLADIITLREQHDFRVHADAAYGGYFVLSDALGQQARTAFDSIGEVDSIVIDPHKHGLQPYGCGCVLFKDQAVGQLYKHDSPYTYFSSDEMHLGEISLECSRPGAAAVALWATQKLLPLEKSGEFARGLDKSLQAARKLFHALKTDKRFITAIEPQLDIVVWAPASVSVSESSELSRRIFAEAASLDLHLAVVKLPVRFFDFSSVSMNIDTDTVTCLRSVLMKPEHLQWVDEICMRLGQAHAAAQTKKIELPA